jgi:hypothetical protein
LSEKERTIIEDNDIQAELEDIEISGTNQRLLLE